MARPSEPNEGERAPARTRRDFLTRVVAPALAAVASAPVVAALAEAQTKKTRRPAAAAKAKPAAGSGDPYAFARPDLSVARTAEERATLEKQWKGMVDVVEAIRKADLPAENTPPALAFAALARDDSSGDRGARRKS
jgi:hypothetical protein